MINILTIKKIVIKYNIYLCNLLLDHDNFLFFFSQLKLLRIFSFLFHLLSLLSVNLFVKEITNKDKNSKYFDINLGVIAC